MKIQKAIRAALLVAVVALISMGSLGIGNAQQRQIVNVYSARHYGAMEGMFVKFTEETGIEVRLSQGSVQSLLQRLEAEGAQTPADVFLTIDGGSLTLAAEKGLLQPIESAVLEANIPAELRDAENRWFGLSQRIRTIVYHPDRVKPEELSTYEDLADPKWQGRLCLRPATHIYTISLTASLIAALGEEKAEEIVKGWAANRKESIDSDARILDTIAAGGCDVGITNHYYLANKLAEDPNFPVKIFFANQGEGDRGVHRNLAGAGITANAVNKDNAVKLIEWLSEAEKGQSPESIGLAGGNREFPVNASAKLNPILESFGTFRIDMTPPQVIGSLQAAAVELLARAGY